MYYGYYLHHCVSLTGRQVSTDSRSSFSLVQTAVDERERIERLQERESSVSEVCTQCPGQMFPPVPALFFPAAVGPKVSEL